MGILRREKRGFTLPEMLLSAFILCYAISMVLVSYINCVALNQSSRSLVSAVSHLEYVLEDIRNSAFSSIAANINAGNWNWNAATINTKGLSALKNESITATASGTNPLNVVVSVSWSEIKGASHRRAISTTISG